MQSGGPSRDEARERLAPLDAATRHQVRRAAAGHVQLEQPLLAAAAVAVARRAMHRARWVLAVSAVVGFAASVWAGIATRDLLVALLIAVGFPLSIGIRYAVLVRMHRKGVKKNLAVLDHHGGDVPAPGAVDAPEVRRQGSADMRKRLVVGAVAWVALVAGTGWVSWHDYHLAQRLRSHGELADAEITGFDSAYRAGELLVGDRWEVRFEAGGRVVETEVLDPDAVRGEKGELVAVLYDPDDPQKARYGEDPSGRAENVWVAVGIGPAAAAAVAIIRWWRRRRHADNREQESRRGRAPA